MANVVKMIPKINDNKYITKCGTCSKFSKKKNAAVNILPHDKYSLMYPILGEANKRYVSTE